MELYRKQFPDDLGGMVREAEFAVTQERYNGAERLLRRSIELAKASSDDEAEDYRNSFTDLLVTALYKQGKVKEAYESVSERKESLSQLFRQAVSNKRWSDVRMLLDLQRAKDPDDPEVHYAAGELAATKSSGTSRSNIFKRA